MITFNYWHLCLAIWLGIVSLSCAQNKVTFELKDDEKLIEFTTDRFTLPNLHVTPDGQNIIFDVLGDIYQVPIEGGKAEMLIQDDNWKRAAKLSPDGKTLAYVSDETGEFQVWTLNLETNEKKVYPIKEYVHFPIYPYWSYDGNLLIPSEDGLFSFDSKTFDYNLIRPAKEIEKSITHETNRNMTAGFAGKYVYFKSNNALFGYDLIKKKDLYIGEFDEPRAKIYVNPEGQAGLYYRTSKENANELELLTWDFITDETYVLTKSNKFGFSTTLKYSFDFIDNKTIILDKEGEIVRMDIETGEYEPIPIEVDVKKVIKKPLRREPQYIRDSIITASVLRNPVTRPNLDTIYFGAFGKLHSYAINSQEITEIYSKKDRFEVSPSLSPDGNYLAFTTWNDTDMGHVYVRELKTRKEYQLTKTPGRYINPTWSPDGTEIVFVADETEAKLGIPRQSGSTNTTQYHLDIHKIFFYKNKELKENSKSDTIYRVYPFSILPKRFYPSLTYHPNGKSLFITTRNHEKDLPVLIQVDLENKEIIRERVIPFHTDEVLVSPDAKHIAFIYDEQVWIDIYPHSIKLEFSEKSNLVPKQYHYKGGAVINILLSNIKSVFEIAPSYLSWQDENTLMWGSAEEVYTYDVSSGKTEKIAEIKVQKPRAIPKTQYALTNARIITMNMQDEIIEKGTILIKDNRIEKVGKVSDIMIPEKYKIFDLEGKTILPGFIDVHAHYHHSPYEFINQQEYQYIGNLAYGITTIYDPSVNALDYRERAQMVEIGRVIGPRIFASGNVIFGRPGINEYDYKEINTITDANRILKSVKKIEVYGPIKEYENRNRRKRKVLRIATSNNEYTITAHQVIYTEAITRVIDGYTALEHELGSFKLQDDVLQFIAKSKVHYTPTFMVSPMIGNLYMSKSLKEKAKLKKFNGQILFKNIMQQRFDNAFIDAPDKNLTLKREVREIKRASSNLKKIALLGGNVSVGGHGNPLPGIGTHWELWAFTYGGLSNYKAIQAATINGAKKLDLQKEIGSIENGKLADIVVLNSNPLEDIFNTIDILYTIQNGNVYESESMKQIYPIEKELKPWGWDSSMVQNSMEAIYFNQE